MEDRRDLNSHSVKRSNSLTAGGAHENGPGKVLGGQFPCVSGNSFRRGASDTNGRGQVRGGQPGTPSTPRKCATSLSFWLTDLSPLYRNLLQAEQLSGTTSSQNILKTTFSVEKQKICGVGSGLVGDSVSIF
jgi:hypothetical protein